MPFPIRVIIADDHQMFLDGINEITASLPDVEVVATATNGEQVIHLLERIPCDVAILDIHMPVQDGLTTTRLIKEQFPRVKVLILTMNNELSLIKSLLEAGCFRLYIENQWKRRTCQGNPDSSQWIKLFQ
jgi:DNA-binding NarL/FixJ family response regulator